MNELSQYIKGTNTILYCKHWEETVEFYRTRLGLPVLFSTDWFFEFELNSKGRISIADARCSSIKNCGGTGLTITLEVESVSTVRQWLLDTGLKPGEVKTHPWGKSRLFYLFDPEGHRLEFWQPEDKVNNLPNARQEE